jgi:hypothetical protein
MGISRIYIAVSTTFLLSDNDLRQHLQLSWKVANQA